MFQFQRRFASANTASVLQLFLLVGDKAFTNIYREDVRGGGVRASFPFCGFVRTGDLLKVILFLCPLSFQGDNIGRPFHNFIISRTLNNPFFAFIHWRWLNQKWWWGWWVFPIRRGWWVWFRWWIIILWRGRNKVQIYKLFLDIIGDKEKWR